MDNYEGFSDLLSNSLRYGLSNKRAIIIWGIIYLVTLLIYIAGLAVLVFYVKNTIAWGIYFLTLIPLIAAAVLMQGYMFRCLSRLFDGDNVAPDVSGIIGMAIDGIKVFIIYMEAIIVMMLIFMPAMLLLMVSDRYPAAIAAYCLLYPVEMILAVLIGAISMVQWAVFADTGSLLKGLNPLTAIKLVIGDLRYAVVAALAAFIIYLLFSVVIMILILPIITAVLMPFAITPVYCAIIYILARFYRHAAGHNIRSLPPPAA
jgi:hypothetical protein